MVPERLCRAVILEMLPAYIRRASRVDAGPGERPHPSANWEALSAIGIRS